MITFKKVATILGSLLVVIFFVSFLFFAFSYFSNEKKTKEYEQQVKTITDKNVALNSKVELFEGKIKEYENEKQTLLFKLSEQEKTLADKEKEIYINNQIKIPEDYTTLKNNYLLLSDNYTLLKSMYAVLKAQSDKDSKYLTESLSLIDELKVQNNDLLTLLSSKPKSSVPFFQQSVLGGASLTYDNKNIYHVAYLATIMNKIQVEAVVSYPVEIGILVGVKF